MLRPAQSLRHRLFSGTAIVGLAFVALCPTPSYAACSTNTPTSGQTVTCTATDTVGISGSGQSNVTVNVDTAADISTSGTYGINLGSNAHVTLGRNASISGGDYGISIGSGTVDLGQGVSMNPAIAVVETYGAANISIGADTSFRGDNIVLYSGAGGDLVHVTYGGNSSGSSNYIANFGNANAHFTLLAYGDTMGTGILAGAGTTDVFELGTGGNGVFNVAELGSNITGFDIFRVNNSPGSTWQLYGTGTYTAAVQLNGGVTSIVDDSAFGNAANVVTINGGTLQFAAGSITVAHSITLGASGGTFDTNGFTDTITGTISGNGVLTKTGMGTLSLGQGTNTYTGGIVIAAGSLHGSTESLKGNIANSGNLTINQTIDGTYAGNLSGTGDLLKAGTGNVTLTGTNTYSGGTNITGGTLTGNTTSLQGNITNSGILAFNQNTNGTYSGVISGSGAVTKSGTGVLSLRGTNTNTGGTTVNGGFVNITADNNLGGAGTLTLNGGGLQFGSAMTSTRAISLGASNGTIDTNGFNDTISSVISGAGSLIKTGTGVLTLSAVNTFLGDTAINGGTVAVSADSGLGAGNNLTFDGGTLRFNAAFNTGHVISIGAGGGTIDTNGFNTTYTNVLSGTGILTKTGAGRLSLTNSNTYAGDTYISGGALNIIADNNLGLGGTLHMNGGTLQSGAILSSARHVTIDVGNATFDTNGFATTLTGIIDGVGSFTKTGTGALNISGTTSSYQGGTFITGGTLIINADANLGLSTTAVNLSNAGIIQFAAGLTSTRNYVIGTGGGTINTASGNSTISGVISGAGLFTKDGANTLTITGANTYTGGTTIAGGILEADTGSVKGNVVANNTTTLRFNQNTNGTYTGNISGAGRLQKQGTGNVTLVGNNTYTGGSTISAGTLTGTTSSLEGDILNSGAIVFDQNTNGSYVEVLSGSGTVTKTGTGVVTFTGTNLYTGLTSVTGGFLRFNADANLGSVASSVLLNGGGLQFAASITTARDVNFAGVGTIDTGTFTDTMSGTLSGVGSLVKIGTGTLILSGTNSYAGSTTISAGTVQGTTASLPSDIIDNANLSFNQSFNGTYASVISGTGTVTKAGTGTVTLTGTNTYSGGTTLTGGILNVSANANLGNASGNLTFNGGTLQLGAPLTIARAASLTGAGTIDTNGNNATLSGVLSGSGLFTKAGTGNLTLTGNNTNTGNIAVNGGSLTGSSTSIRGNIANAGIVIFDEPVIGMYFNDISGAGSVQKIGAGTLSFTGTNTYTGGTTISGGILSITFDANLGAAAGTLTFNGGTLRTDSGITSTRNIVLTGAGTIDTYGVNSTVNGNITGAGAFTKAGFGGGTLTLGGTNTYSGGTTVSAGTLAGTTASLQGAILNNAIVAFNQSGNGTYAGNMSGTGVLNKLGTGNVTLSGTNTYSGGTTVSAGTLTGTTSSLQGNITNNAAVVFDQNTTGGYAGNMSGTGSLTAQGGGTINLGGTNTYSGGTTVATSTRIAGNTSAIQGNIANSGTVSFLQSTAGTYSGILSGSGAVNFTGSGFVTLSGVNTYTGATTNNGNVIVSSNSGFGSTSGISMTAGTIRYGASYTDTHNIAMNGASTLDTNGFNVTLSGVISGPGISDFTKTGTGTLTLTGTNTNTGTITVSAGTLKGNTNSIKPNVVNNSAVIFDLASGTYAGAMSGTGTLSVANNSALTVTGTNTYSGGTTVDATSSLTGNAASIQGNIVNSGTVNFLQNAAGIFAGDISGTGGVGSIGTNVITFTGHNTYSGPTVIKTGGISIASASSIGTGNIAMSDLGSLHLGNTVALNNTINLGANGGGVIGVDSGSATLNGAITGTTLEKTGSGELILTGTNTYSGGTTVSAGTLTGTTNSIQGDIENNAIVKINQAGSGTYAGDMSGTGAFVKDGTGNVTMSGTNTYSGGTVINQGTLTGNSDSLQGDITNNDSIVFNQTTDGTMSGDISGTGDFTKTGTGNLTLSGTNTYSGGTAVSGGTLTGTTDSLQGNIANNAAVVFDQGGSGTYAGAMSGTGSLTLSGGADYILTGTNTYSGGTTLDDGSLTGTTSSIQGNIVNNGNIDIDQAGNGTYAGDMSGTGSFVKDGAGNVTLSGTNTYAGGTIILAGTLSGTSNSLQGDIINDSHIVFDQNTNGTYAGTLSGSGDLTKAGSGTLQLSGTNTYTGDTIINGGALQADSDAALGDTGNHIYVNNARFIFGGAFTSDRDITLGAGSATFDTNGYDDVLTGNIDGTGSFIKDGLGTLLLTGTRSYTGGTTILAGNLMDNNGVIQGDVVNNGTFTINQDTDGSFTGIISGTGIVVKDGLGNVTLTSANTYSGGTVISGGTLTGTTTTLRGDIEDNSVMAYDQNFDGTMAGDISGTGALNILGSGNITLTGTNTYSGGTNVANGTLTGDTNSIQGTIVNDSTVVFDQGFDGTYASNMSGSGQLVKDGTGNVTLSGTNSYTGGTSILDGTLTGTTNSLQGDIANSGTIAFDQNTNGTYGGVISGSGGFEKLGTGAVTLSGANTYTGGTIISDGRLIGTTTSLQGDIVDNAELEFAQNADGTYADNISGTGSVIKSGSGNVTFTGTNTYLGGTSIEAGTLTGTTDNIMGDTSIATAAKLVLDQDADGIFAGDISGNGSFTKDGDGNITLSGTNTYLGGTTILGGALTGDTTSLQGNIANSGTINFNQASDGTMSGNISGSGAFVKDGAGNLTLSGTNTYTGTTTITDGTLTGTTSSISGNVINNAALVYDQATDGTAANNISGTGTLTKDGAGNVTLTGTNTYSGGTTISGGTLTGNTTSLQGDILNNAALAFNQLTNGTFAGDISGTGSFTKDGAGNLTLSGTNTYSGGTTIDAGTLTGNTASLQGNVVNQGALVLNQTLDDTFTGDISGNGTFVKDGAGNLTLVGTNSYAGGTTINAGTLTGDTDSVQGDVINNAALVIDQAANGTLAGDISGTGTFTKDGAGNVTLTGTNTYTGGTTISGGTLTGDTASLQGNVANNASVVIDQAASGTYAGNMSGSGDLTLSGGGTVTLTGTNTYTGGTTALTDVVGTTSSLQGNVVNNASVTFDQTANGTYAGDMSGTGDVAKNGSSTVTLTGTNTYSGTTAINEGTLAISAATAIGSGDILIDDLATLRTNAATTLNNDIFLSGSGGRIDTNGFNIALNGIIDGTKLVKTGLGELALTGTNTYTGGTEILAGSLLADTASLQGDVLNNGLLTIAQTIAGTFAGDISGTGAFLKAGIGDLKLTGTNTYTGGTTISAGTLTGDTTSLQGNIVNNAAIVFDQATDATYAGNLSGTGVFTKLGAGNLTVTGTNTLHHTSAPTYIITDGTLTGTTSSLQSDIENNAALVFDQNTAGTFGSIISGTGTLTKLGTANVILSGVNTYTGDTFINAGRLSVNGSAANSAFYVGALGTLGGRGTVGELTVDGHLAPGNSIDTLHVNGGVTFNTGSVYEVEINASGAGDKTIATGAITINGGTVAALGASGAYAQSTVYNILTGASRTGMFDSVSSNLAFLDPTLIYTATTVDLKMDRNDASFGSIGTDDSQKAVAAAVENLGAGNDLHDAFTGLTADDARKALDQLSGEHIAGTLGAAAQSTANLSHIALARMHALSYGYESGGALTGEQSVTQNAPIVSIEPAAGPVEKAVSLGRKLWMQALGTVGSTQARGSAPEQNRGSLGFVGGIDVDNIGGGFSGVYAGWEQGHVSTPGQNASSGVQSWHAGAYRTKPMDHGDWRLSGGVGASLHNIDSTRYIEFPGYSARVEGDTNAATFTAYIEAAKPLEYNSYILEPFASMQAIYSRMNGYTESGGSSADLKVDTTTQANLAQTLGVRVNHEIDGADMFRLNVHATAGWQHLYGAIDQKTTMRFDAGNTPFSVSGAGRSRDALVIGGGVDTLLNSRVTGYASYDGTLSRNDQDHAFTMGFKIPLN